MTDVVASASNTVSSFHSEMLCSPLCRPADSGVSSDNASNDGDRVTEIADLALDLAMSSSDEESDVPDTDVCSTPAMPRTKFCKERPTPRQLPVSWPLDLVQDVVTSTTPSSLSSAGMSSHASANTPSSSTAAKGAACPEPECGRCTGKHHGKHTAGCPDRGRFKSYATCTRCQCISTTKKQWRFHIAKCQSSRLKDTPAPQHSWDDHVTHVTTAIVQLVCNHCDQWRTIYRHMLNLHKVLCTAAPDGYIPALPRADTMRANVDDATLELSFAMTDQLLYAFKLKPILASFESVGYLHELAVQSAARRQVGGAAPVQARAVTAAMDLTNIPPPPTPPAPMKPPSPPQISRSVQSRQPNPATRRLRPHDDRDLPRLGASVGPVRLDTGNVSCSAANGPGLVSAAAMRHCFPPTATLERGRKRTRYVDDLHRRADAAGEERRWCTPAELPSKLESYNRDVTVSNMAVDAAPSAMFPASSMTYRDRFKIQRSNGHWTDAYGRSTSPPSAVKKRLPKPDVTFVGILTSSLMFGMPVQVSVSGHLPTGPGRFNLPRPLAANEAYKSTPGDDSPVPALALRMSHRVRLFFADNPTEFAGELMTDVPLYDYTCLEYKSADVTSVVRMQRLTPAAQPSVDAPQ